MTAKVSLSDKATTSTHEALNIVINLKHKLSTALAERKVFNFKNADYDLVFQLLSCISWCNLDKFASISDALSHVYILDIIFCVMKDVIPQIKIRTQKYPYWYDKHLISLLREKERHRRSYVKCG